MENKIFVIRLPHGQPVIIAASSISPETCSIAFVPLRDAKGKNFMPPTMMHSATVDYSLSVVAMFKK